MADNNQLQVTLTGDATALLASLEAAQEKIKALSKTGKEETNSLNDAFSQLSVEKLLTMAVGFGTLAGAANAALGLIVTGIKNIISIIPNSIDATKHLAETYEQLSITAGMSIDDFNKYNAAISLAGGKAEDLNDIVKGMERGIKQHSEALVANGVFASQDALNHATLGEYIQAVVTKMREYGDATSRDQLLLDAFGKSGMAFAATLERINDQMDRGSKLSLMDGVLSQKALEQAEKLRVAEGELNIQKDLSKRLISESVTDLDIAIKKEEALTLQRANEFRIVQQLVKDGLIPLTQKTIEYEDEQHQRVTQVVEDWSATTEAAKKYLETIKELNKYAKDENDVGVNREAANKRESTAAYDPHKAEKEKEAAKEADRARIEAMDKALEDFRLRKAQEHRIEADYYQLSAKETLDFWQKQLATNRNGEESIKKIHSEIITAKKAMLAQADSERKASFERELSEVKGNYTAQLALAGQNLTEVRKYHTEESAEYQLALKKIQDIRNAQALEERRVESLELEGKRKHEAAMLQLELEAVKVALAQGRISDEEALRDRIAIEKTQYDAERKALMDRLALANLEKTERQSILNQIQALDDAHNRQMVQGSQQLYDLMRQKNPMLGLRDGAKAYYDQAVNYYAQYGQAVRSVLNSTENTLARSLQSMLLEHKRLGDAIREVWKGIGTAVVQEITQMVARWIVAQAAMAIVGKSAQVAQGTQASAALDLAVAESYAAYAAIPFGGLALAQAQIAAIMAGFGVAKAADKGITAMETGGLVKAGSWQRTILGDGADDEIVAPERPFKAVLGGWLGSIVGSVSAHASRMASMASTSYTPSGSAFAGAGAGGGYVDLRGAVIAGESVESSRIIGNLVKQHLDSWSKRKG